MQRALASSGFGVKEEGGKGGLCMMVVGPDRMVVQTGKKKKKGLKFKIVFSRKKQNKSSTSLKSSA